MYGGFSNLPITSQCRNTGQIGKSALHRNEFERPQAGAAFGRWCRAFFNLRDRNEICRVYVCRVYIGWQINNPGKNMASEVESKIAAGYWNWAGVPVEQIGEGIERQMITGDRLMICRLRFAPRIVTPAHQHPHEQMTIVEQGRVRFIIGDSERIVEAGDVLHFPSGCWHGATMLDEEVVLIDIFTPLREDFLAAGKVTD